MTHICKNFYLIKDGMGGFLNPPGDSEHDYSIREGKSDISAVGFYSLSTAASETWIPDEVRKIAQSKLDSSKRECSEKWVQSVYNYFRNCYSPDGINRNCSDCIVDNTNEQPPKYHLAFLHIKRFFSEHEPRLDLIENNGPLGSWSKS